MNQIKLKQDRFRQITDVSDIFIINLEKRKDRYKHMINIYFYEKMIYGGCASAPI